MTELTETITEVTPALGKKVVFISATKEAQNDTIALSDYSAVYLAVGFTNGSAETITISGTTLTLAGAGTGSFYGLAVVTE